MHAFTCWTLLQQNTAGAVFDCLHAHEIWLDFIEMMTPKYAILLGRMGNDMKPLTYFKCIIVVMLVVLSPLVSAQAVDSAYLKSNKPFQEKAAAPLAVQITVQAPETEINPMTEQPVV